VSAEPGLLAEIDRADEMFEHSTPEHYFSVGRSALACIEAALAAAGSGHDQIRRVLDLPCGHGRVLRWLKRSFPAATLTACDLNFPGVDFCASALGAEPVYSVPDPKALVLPDGYDLIWCGSLLTHLDPEGWAGFLRRFESSLAVGGVAVISTHGERTREWIVSGHYRYGLPDARCFKLLFEHLLTGFGYQDYPGSEAYGISLSSERWVRTVIERAMPASRVVSYQHAAWDGHHDVVAVQRVR